MRDDPRTPPHHFCEAYGDYRCTDPRCGANFCVGAGLPPVDERKAILEEAAGLTTADRNQTYGAPEDNFTRIALHWAAFFKNRFGLTIQIEAADVAILMILMKAARLEFKITHRDSWVDTAGYAACGAAIVANMTRDQGEPTG